MDLTDASILIVIGSRGSVIPLFRAQRAVETVTGTDPTMTRFWISRPRSVELVVRCRGLMRGGEIFVPKLPSTRIMDLVIDEGTVLAWDMP